MKNNEIIYFLKEQPALKGNRIKLPSSIDFEIKDKTLHIKLTKVVENMQDNKSSFDGWIIVLKSWISLIEKVELSWDIPSIIDIKQGLHYNRFKYRVVKFTERYSWCSIEDKMIKEEIQVFTESYLHKMYLNKMSLNRDNKDYNLPLINLSENQLENIVAGIYKSAFLKMHDLLFLKRQLPIGVFKNSEIKTIHAIFPHKRSAIDLWGISKQNELFIYELKKVGNNTIGCLSEMLFYSWVYEDVVEGKAIMSDDIYNNHKFEKIKCYLLAPEIHPLINNKNVFLLLNKNSFNSTYGYIDIKEINNKLMFKNVF